MNKGSYVEKGSEGAVKLKNSLEYLVKATLIPKQEDIIYNGKKIKCIKGKHNFLAWYVGSHYENTREVFGYKIKCSKCGLLWHVPADFYSYRMLH